MLDMLRERYLAEHNAQLASMLTDPKKNETDRFWDTMEEMEKQAKVLKDCLDGYSRSKMWLHVMMMVRCGMMRQEDLEGFSEELRSKAEYVLKDMKG